MKVAVVYFSLEGNTDLIADIIVSELGAEKIRLQLRKNLPASKFGRFFFGGMSAVFNLKPELKNAQQNLEEYDTIIFGTPIWASRYASAFNTFFSKNKIKNKKIFLFACHSGGGASKCFEQFTNALSGNEIKGTIDFVLPKNDNSQLLKEKVLSFCNKIKE